MIVKVGGMLNKFQSTLPRGERRGQIFSCEAIFLISIHAPTRGATSFSRQRVTCFWISIHAPTRGATLNQQISGIFSLYFNPRSHEGSDDGQVLNKEQFSKFQSTLPRGERHCRERDIKDSSVHFNPRSHEGSDIYSKL